MSVTQHACTETFIRESDNRITVTLNENGVPISGAWDEVKIFIGNPSIVTITRPTSGAGVTLAEVGGILQIQPSELTEDVSELVAGKLYPVHVQLKSPANPNGVDFGADDSDTRLLFLVRDRPAAAP